MYSYNLRLEFLSRRCQTTSPVGVLADRHALIAMVFAGLQNFASPGITNNLNSSSPVVGSPASKSPTALRFAVKTIPKGLKHLMWLVVPPAFPVQLRLPCN